MLECEGVTKAYGGLLAVNDVTFSVEEGEIFAIVGPNGAGKTTLFDTISAISPPTSGVIRFDGVEIHRLRPHRICQLGLARLFQTSVSFSSQTVLTNVLVGSMFGHQGRSNPTLRFRPDAIEAGLEALDACDLLDKQQVRASELPVLDLKRLMLATALATKAKLLLLDEPVAGLNRDEREQMIALVRGINESGVTIVMIEHVMKAVHALAGRMLVLHHGAKIVEGPPSQVLTDKRVAEVYLGETWAARDPQRQLVLEGTNGEESADARRR